MLKTERAYVAWHPSNGFAMWTLAGSQKGVRQKCDACGPWPSAWAAEGWRIKRVRVSIY